MINGVNVSRGVSAYWQQGGDQLSNHYMEIGGCSLSSFINELPFYIGNIVKYVWRAPYKNKIDDTLKMLDYLDMSHFGWVEFALSDRGRNALSKISSHDFYSSESDIDYTHRRCIASVAEWILCSECLGSSERDSEARMVLMVASLQVALLHK